MTIHQRFRLFIGVGLFAFLCVASASRSFAMDARADLSFSDIAARVKNSVVTVAAAAVDARQAGRPGRGRESRADGGERSLLKTSARSGRKEGLANRSVSLPRLAPGSSST